MVIVHVAAFPAFANPTGNRYNALLSSALQRLNVTVDEWAPALWPRRVDIIHVHWPEVPLNIARPSHAAVRSAQTLESLIASKAQGARVVWTAHNVRSHLHRRPRAERLYTTVFDRLVDGWIALTETSAELALAAHPALAGKPCVVTPHGHYRGAYPDDVSRDIARARFGLDDRHRVAVFVGLIRAYKGVDTLVEVFTSLPDPDVRLLIGGRCDDAALAEHLRAAARSDPRITLRLEAIADDELQCWLRASDVTVLPYRTLLNSGTALLSLSFDVPILCPAVGSLVELADELPAWVRVYDGDLTPSLLRDALHQPPPPGRPDLRRYDWEEVARQTLGLYRRLLSETAP